MQRIIQFIKSLLETIVAAFLFTAIRFVVVAAIVFPVTYFVHGSRGPGHAVIGIVFGSVASLFSGKKDKLYNWQLWIIWGVIDIIYGMSYGLAFPSYANIASISPYQAALILAIGAFSSATVVSWVIQIVDPTHTIFPKTSAYGGPLAATFVFGILIPLLPFLGALEQLPERQRYLYLLLALPSWWLGIKVGYLLGKLTKILTVSGIQVASQVRTLGAAGIFFLVGYVLLATFYATIYAAIWRADNAAFSGDGLPTNPSLFDFLYFSVMTVATVGYGDFFPKSTVARGVAMSETLFGMAWITLVLAATVARLTSSSSAILDCKKPNKSDGSEKSVDKELKPVPAPERSAG